MPRALQLTAAAISVVDAIALSKTTESQALELTEKRIMVTIYFVERLPDSSCKTSQKNSLKGLIMYIFSNLVIGGAWLRCIVASLDYNSTYSA